MYNFQKACLDSDGPEVLLLPIGFLLLSCCLDADGMADMPQSSWTMSRPWTMK